MNKVKDPTSQPLANSGIPDRQGGTPTTQGLPVSRPVAPGVPGPGTPERIGGFNDRPVPKKNLP